MSYQFPGIAAFAHSLCYALLHSLWQGALVFTVLYFTLRLFKGLSSNARYLLSYSSLLLLLLGFMGNFISQWQLLHTGALNGDVIISSFSNLPVHAASATQEQVTTCIIEQARPLFPWLALCYIMGIILLTIRFIAGIINVKRLKYQQTATPDASLLQLLEQLKQTMGIRRPVTLMLTQKLTVPVVFGALKPVLLLPVASLSNLTMEQLEAILIHELAHIKRNDYLLNIFQMVGETILFFNPFTWLISAIIRREREHCCDDIVLTQTVHPLPYAKALALLETYRSYYGKAALAANGNKQHLLHRIKRITTMKQQHINYGQVIAATLLLAVLGISVATFTPGFAQVKKDDKKKSVRVKEERITIIDDDGHVRTYNSLDDVPQEDRERLDIKDAKLKQQMYYGSKGRTVSISADSIRIVEAMDEVKEKMKDIDVDAIVSKAMKEVDWDDIKKQMKDADLAMAEANKAIKDMDWKAMERDMKESDVAMEAADMALKAAGDALALIDWDEIQRSVDEGMKDARVLMRSKEVREAIAAGKSGEAQARRSIAAARSIGPNTFDKMLRKMEAEGLINRKDGFNIKKTGDRLYINGEEQYDYIYNRYQQYLKGRNITIKGDEDNLNIKVKN